MVLENPKNTGACEIMLNEYAKDGWRVTGFTQYQILIEKEVTENELLTENMG